MASLGFTREQTRNMKWGGGRIVANFYLQKDNTSIILVNIRIGYELYIFNEKNASEEGGAD